MYKGTIVENSLKDTSVLSELTVTKTWRDGDWTLYNVIISEDQISGLAKCLNNGPWYIHLWKEGTDEVRVIFKEKIFTIKHSDKSTWTSAVSYGKSIGIPEQQLDFPILSI